MNAEQQASIIALANANGIDTDNEGDIFGSTNGALLKFAEALLAGRAKPEASAIPAPPPPPSTRFVRDDRPPEQVQSIAAAPAASVAPVAPKGPFADCSAEEVEAYAREYATASAKQ